jgi:hypothetical protein
MIASAAGIAARPFVLLPLPLLVSARKCGLSAAQILVPQLPLLMAATGMAGAVSFLQYGLKPYVSGVILLLILASSGFVIYSGLVAARFPQFAAQCVKRASAWADGIF